MSDAFAGDGKTNKGFVLCVLVFVLTLTFPALAQNETLPKVEPSTAITIKYNIFVTDGADQLITDIKKEDLIVKVNGKEVSDFSLRSVPAPTLNVLAVDNSGSMRTILEETVDSAKKIVSVNSDEDIFAVVRFVGSDEIRLESNFKSDSKELNKAIELLYIQPGRTAVVDAIYVCAELLATFDKIPIETRKTVIVISDGEDRDSVYDRKQLARLLKASNIGIVFVGIHSELKDVPLFARTPADKSRKLIEYLIEEAGGFALYPKKMKEFVLRADLIVPVIRKNEYVEILVQDGTARITIELKKEEGKKNFRIFSSLRPN